MKPPPPQSQWSKLWKFCTKITFLLRRDMTVGDLMDMDPDSHGVSGSISRRQKIAIKTK